MMKVEIDPEGVVVKAEIIHGHPLLRLAAVKAIRQCKYKPMELPEGPYMLKFKHKNYVMVTINTCPPWPPEANI